MRPPSEQEKKSTIKKRTPRCMRALRRQKKRAPRCMGAFRPKNGRQKRDPKKRSKPFKINAFECFFGEALSEVAPSTLSATLHGNASFQKINEKPCIISCISFGGGGRQGTYIRTYGTPGGTEHFECPTGLGEPKGNPRRHQKLKKGACRIL